MSIDESNEFKIYGITMNYLNFFVLFSHIDRNHSAMYHVICNISVRLPRSEYDIISDLQYPLRTAENS